VHAPLDAPEEDEAAAARAVLEALGGVRGLGEVNLVYLLRADARAADWLVGRAGWGALAHRSESKVRALVRALEAGGLVARETLEHGGAALRLAEKGALALASGAPVVVPGPGPRPSPGPRPAAPGPRPAAPGRPVDADPTFEALRAWRRATADAEGVPPFVVAHDTTLRAIAAARPTSLAELRAVKGMGPKRVEKYGKGLLRALDAAT
jgi:superfamily II DNA helicase RecQ